MYDTNYTKKRTWEKVTAKINGQTSITSVSIISFDNTFDDLPKKC